MHQLAAGARVGLMVLGMAVAAGAAGCELPPRAAVAAESGLGTTSKGTRTLAPFTVVVLPDTQYYSSDHPEIFEAQTRWIVAERRDLKIALVVHEGDIVDGDEPRQWERASHSLRALDGLVPYVLSAGNHDYHRVGNQIDRRTSMDDYFPAWAFAQSSGFRETFQPGRIENSFDIVDTSGGPWLILSLEFGPRDVVLQWADRIAKRYAALPAMVLTHAYLYSDNTRYDHLSRPDQMWNPHLYLNDALPGDVNDGEEIWRKLISGNDNIRFVLCGHDLVDGTAQLTSVRPDGTTVHQLLANYQTGARGGDGYLRLMQFFPAERRVMIRTYSPTLDEFKSDPANQFALEY